MTSPNRLDPLAFAGSFAYLQADLPPGMTLPAWRRERNRPAGAGLAPQAGTPFGVRLWARRPRSGRGPSRRRYQ